MLKGGVIMDVVNAEQARIAEEAGAVAVMALERVPADIRKHGGVARMSDPQMIREIMDAVTIPVMAKARIGHIVEAQILQALGVDFVDESEVLTPADEQFHINKHAFQVPFVCGCRDLGEALRRIGEGAAMIRTKGEAGTGNIVEAVRHMRSVMAGMRRIQAMDEAELMTEAKNLRPLTTWSSRSTAPASCPCPTFSAGGVRHARRRRPDGPARRRGGLRRLGHLQVGRPGRARQADRGRRDLRARSRKLAEISTGLGEPMVGIDIRQLDDKELLATRGW
jgi:pyridoxal 5'-phosphate synthase pdxS subunit